MFTYLRANEIGLCFALFWEAWAVVLELKEAFGDADKVYVEGIARGADPVKRLRLSQQAFIKRMGRRLLSQSATPARADSDDDRVRAALAQLPTHVGALREPIAAGRGGGLPGARASVAPRHNAGFVVFDENASGGASAPTLSSSLVDPWAEAHVKENVGKAEKWSDYSVPQQGRAVAPVVAKLPPTTGL